MDNETWILIDKIGIAVGLLLMVLGLTGEILGWWNDVGVIVTAFGLLLGLLGAMDVNGRRLLSRYTAQEAVLGRVIGNQEAMLGNQEAMLGNQEAMIETQETGVRALHRIVELLDQRLPQP